jgi:hypothetical protein
MQKLGLAEAEHVESSDFNRYLDLFRDGLTDAHVQLIRELFLNRVPPPEEGTLVEEEQ